MSVGMGREKSARIVERELEKGRFRKVTISLPVRV